MIDIHSHIIYGLDDGPDTLEESVRMICEAEEMGVKVIIATPHLRNSEDDIANIVERYEELNQRIIGYDVTLVPGYEVILSPNIRDVVLNKGLTLGMSRYLLVELPFNSIPFYIDEAIYGLQLEGIIPILSHPERNIGFQKRFDALESLAARGCFLQVDAGSIVGAYGRTVKEFVKKLIRLNMVHFIASDARCAQDYTNWYLKAYHKVIKWAGREYAEMLFYKNPGVILENIKADAKTQAAYRTG